jgi:hypothetical protein
MCRLVTNWLKVNKMRHIILLNPIQLTSLSMELELLEWEHQRCDIAGVSVISYCSIMGFGNGMDKDLCRRRIMDEKVFERAYAAGAAMSLDEATAYALGEIGEP